MSPVMVEVVLRKRIFGCQSRSLQKSVSLPAVPAVGSTINDKGRWHSVKHVEFETDAPMVRIFLDSIETWSQSMHASECDDLISVGWKELQDISANNDEVEAMMRRECPEWFEEKPEKAK